MLTNNFYKIMISLMTKPSMVIAPTRYDGTSSSTITDPEYLFEGMRYVRSATFKSGLYGTFFGTGTTPPTRDDYKLESPITDGTLYSSVQTAPVQGFDEDHARLYVTHEVHNTGTEDITVSEVGIFGCARDSSNVIFLLDRTVLDTPITIPAGGQKSVTIAVRFDYPVK